MKTTLFALAFLLLSGLAGAAENSCVNCHQGLTEPNQKKMYLKWDNSPHEKAGVFCNDCHGGDPLSSDKLVAHKSANFGEPALEKMSPKNINEVCGNCHLQVYREFRKSVHGENQESGHLAPTCGDCHYELQGRTIAHSQLNDFCGKCHRMTGKEASFFLAFDAVRYKELSDETRKTIETARKMLDYQLALKKKTISEDNIALAGKLLTISEVSLHNAATSWHRFQAEEIHQQSERAYYLAQTAIDLLLPEK